MFSRPLRFPNQNCVCIYHLTHFCYVLRTHGYHDYPFWNNVRRSIHQNNRYRYNHKWVMYERMTPKLAKKKERLTMGTTEEQAED